MFDPGPSPPSPPSSPAISPFDAHRLPLPPEELPHPFPPVASALRGAAVQVLASWRAQCMSAMPELRGLTIEELESPVRSLLDALAGAMEIGNPERARRIIAASPAYGVARFKQKRSLEELLTEERILRAVIVAEVRQELRGLMSTTELAALHELLDLMGEHSVLALVHKQIEGRERAVQARMTGMRQAAGLGNLVAGVADEAANLILPLYARLEHLENAELTPTARKDVAAIGRIIKQYQNAVVNLRWLSIDSANATLPSSTQSRPAVSLCLNKWGAEAAEFHVRIRPPGVEFRFELSPDLPRVLISPAALSQAVFCLIRNAQQAIAAGSGDGQRRSGHIVVRATQRMLDGVGGNKGVGVVDLVIEDDGAGMTPEVLRRCSESFFTTSDSSSGLGLALVRALVNGSGGTIEFQSPPPGKLRGTAAVLTLQLAAEPSMAGIDP